MLLTMLAAGAVAGISKGLINSAVSAANKRNEMQLEQQYKLEQMEKQYGYDTQLAEQQYGYDAALKAQQGDIDAALKAQQGEIDTALKAQQYGYDKQLANQKYGFDSALSAQAAQQDLAKQIQQQDYEKMMSDTEMQRKIADYKAAGVNPALAMGGVSNTNAQSGAAQATAEAPNNAKEAKINPKQEMNAQNMMAITNAVKAGVLEIATKKLNIKAKKLALNPKNKKLENSLKREMISYYNLIRV